MPDQQHPPLASGIKSLAEEGVAVKDDAEKPRFDLIPVDVLEEVAAVFTLGAKKYSAYNYRGLKYSRMIAALLRHLWAWRRGEEIDPETGYSHLAAVICNAMMLRDTQIHQTGIDDRSDNIPQDRT